MRYLYLIVLISLPFAGVSQKKVDLGRKYLGKYRGTVSAYEFDSGNEVIRVTESSIYVTITKDELSVAVGKDKYYGKYAVMFEADTYYLLDANIEGQLATERIMVYKRGRKIARDGMYPQPVTQLKKYR